MSVLDKDRLLIRREFKGFRLTRIHARFDVSEFDLLSGVLVRGETYAEVEP